MANNHSKIHLALRKGNMVLNGKYNVLVKVLPPPRQVDTHEFIILGQCVVQINSVKWYIGCLTEGTTPEGR